MTLLSPSKFDPTTSCLISDERARQDRQARLLIGPRDLPGATALAGGLMLIVHRDGSILRANESYLSSSPYSDWRVPGFLLAGLVGGGFFFSISPPHPYDSDHYAA